MKAIRVHNYGGPETLVLDEASLPGINDEQVLVKINAASVNHIDKGIASGAMQQIFPVQLPWIPGEDFAGIIEKVGKNVTAYKQGDAVYGFSTRGSAYAEYVAVKPGAIAKKPASISFQEAASVPVAAVTAWQGVFTHGLLEKGQVILIHGGAGAVGAYAVQFAHQAGAKVIVTASSNDKAFLLSIGADKVIDYKNEKFETEISNVDVVFDLVGGDTQQKSYGVIKQGGRLVTANQPPSKEEADKHKITALMMDMEPLSKDLNTIAGLLDAGKIKLGAVKVYPLANAAEAWKAHGKAVLQVV